MTIIRETLILGDGFMSTVTQRLQVVQRMVNMPDDARASTMDVGTAAVAITVQI